MNAKPPSRRRQALEAAPPGLNPLPRQALVLKALDTEAYLALCQGASRLKLGWGGYSPWLRAHVDPDATHHIVPDPADGSVA